MTRQEAAPTEWKKIQERATNIVLLNENENETVENNRTESEYWFS